MLCSVRYLVLNTQLVFGLIWASYHGSAQIVRKLTLRKACYQSLAIETSISIINYFWMASVTTNRSLCLWQLYVPIAVSKYFRGSPIFKLTCIAWSAGEPFRQTFRSDWRVLENNQCQEMAARCTPPTCPTFARPNTSPYECSIREIIYKVSSNTNDLFATTVLIPNYN